SGERGVTMSTNGSIQPDGAASSETGTATATDPQLLRVEHLSVSIKQARQEPISVVTDVSFALRRGETLGLVGESGCGKTMTSLAIMGVRPGSARVAADSIQLDGRDLVGLPEAELESMRGRDMAMIFQDAIRCLNPAFTVGNQIAEVARRHL